MMTLTYPPPFQDLRTLAEHTCIGESTIEAMVAEGRFPQPRRGKLGKRLWVWKEVEAFLSADDNVTLIDRGRAIREATKRLRDG